VSVALLEMLNSGVIENEHQLIQLADSYGQLVIPSEDGDLDLTHWWAIKDDGAEMLYIGTPDTFATYIKERNGGVH
jgi:hypothetical protein